MIIIAVTLYLQLASAIYCDDAALELHLDMYPHTLNTTVDAVNGYEFQAQGYTTDCYSWLNPGVQFKDQSMECGLELSNKEFDVSRIIENEQYTISTWINIANINGQEAVLFALGYEGFKGSIFVGYSAGAFINCNEMDNSIGNQALQPGGKYHLVMSRSAGQINCYVYDLDTVSLTTTQTFSTGNLQLLQDSKTAYVGNRVVNGVSNQYEGKIWQISVWNRQLSDEDADIITRVGYESNCSAFSVSSKYSLYSSGLSVYSDPPSSSSSTLSCSSPSIDFLGSVSCWFVGSDSSNLRTTITNDSLEVSCGYVGSISGIANVSFVVHDTSCSSITIQETLSTLSFELTRNPPTPSPTPSPTASPTPSPTASPTPSPTASPTPSPTASPTPSPTSSPTLSPTASPTPSPTSSPTPGVAVNHLCEAYRFTSADGSYTFDPCRDLDV